MLPWYGTSHHLWMALLGMVDRKKGVQGRPLPFDKSARQESVESLGKNKDPAK